MAGTGQASLGDTMAAGINGAERHEGQAALTPHPDPVHRPKVEAIGTARAIFPRCQFDEAGCSVGLKRLRAYRKEWDAERGVWKDRPRHDDASHGADAFMTFACSGIADREELKSGTRDRYRQPYRSTGGLSWMAA